MKTLNVNEKRWTKKKKKISNETLEEPDDIKTEKITRDKYKSSNQPKKIFS